MIYTSYFACKNKPKKLKKVSAALYSPRWFQVDGKANELFPSKELLKGYKDGKIDKKEYRKQYMTQLEKLDARKIAEKYDECILYCYEKPTDFCHRHIIREWLKKHNIDSVELPTKVLKIAVVGSSTIINYELIEEKLNAIRKMNEFVLITGGALGVDTLAERYAKENDIPKVIYKPNTLKNGKTAKQVRNIQVVSSADIIIAFWDGISRGTKSVLRLAKDAKKEIIIVNVRDKNV